MSFAEAREYASLRLEVARLKVELRQARAMAKYQRTAGYNEAKRHLAHNPPRGLLLEAWRAGKAERRQG